MAVELQYYAGIDAYSDAVGATFHTLDTLKLTDSDHNFYNQPQHTIQEWDAASPMELRREGVEQDARDCRQLTRILEAGPFGACNQKVAKAIRESIDDATGAFLAAHHQQEDGSGKYQKDSFSFDASISLQVMAHTLASAAAVFGALDYQDAFVNYSTQLYNGVKNSERLQHNGRHNEYLTRYLGVMEWPEEDDVDLESPTYFHIKAAPGKRVSMETQFVSPTLSERFESHAAHKDKRYKTVDFSLRVDYDDKSPNGLSFDIGRDQRETSTFQRDADAAGSSLAQTHKHGSHFTDRFADVSKQDMEEFIAGIAAFLTTDAEMQRYDDKLKNLEGLSPAAWHAKEALYLQRLRQKKSMHGLPTKQAFYW